MSNNSKFRVVIVPGNGCTDTMRSNWYGWAVKTLKATNFFEDVLAPDMPSPLAAEREIWLPFLLKKMNVNDGRTIVVGHSSGAVAALRLLEDVKIKCVVLVSACHTDLECLNEAKAHYYPPSECSKAAKCGDGGPWKWDTIRKNCDWIVQFHSTDDRFIPADEARFVASKLSLSKRSTEEIRERGGGKYVEFDDRDHFFRPFPELIEEICAFVRGTGGRDAD